jgi:hypothetical protein
MQHGARSNAGKGGPSVCDAEVNALDEQLKRLEAELTKTMSPLSPLANSFVWRAPCQIKQEIGPMTFTTPVC